MLFYQTYELPLICPEDEYIYISESLCPTGALILKVVHSSLLRSDMNSSTKMTEGLRVINRLGNGLAGNHVRATRWSVDT
jgi:hypothetical protein